MNNNKKKNRIILCICSIFILVASIFSFIPSNNSKVVYADTNIDFRTYYFSGSNISSKTTFNSFNDIVLWSNGTINTTTGRVIADNSRCWSDFYIDAGLTYTINLPYSCFRYALIFNDRFDVIGNYMNSFTFSQYTDSFSFISNKSGMVRFVMSNTDNSVVDIDYFNTNVKISGSRNYSVDYKFDFYHSLFKFDNYMVSNITSDGQYYKLYSYTNGINFNVNYGDAFKYSSATIPPSDLNPPNSSYYLRPQELTYKLYDQNTSSYSDSYMFNIYSCYFYLPPSDDSNTYGTEITKVILGSYKDYDTMFYYPYSDFTKFDLSTQKYNFISYIDSYNHSFNFFIPLDSQYDSDYWSLRTYYLSTDSIVNDSYSLGYNEGYRTGYDLGNTRGQEKGYTNGYNTGKNDGYNLGYNQALENGEKYTFTALISSVIDVPVKAFTSLFNFEILGVNLSGFFLGLLTCCIVIGVIRLIL